MNETLPAAARIRKFVLLYKELDADDEELTRTRKVRRGFVEERYQEVIDALYGDAPRGATSTPPSSSRTARPPASGPRSSSGGSSRGKAA